MSHVRYINAYARCAISLTKKWLAKNSINLIGKAISSTFLNKGIVLSKNDLKDADKVTLEIECAGIMTDGEVDEQSLQEAVLMVIKDGHEMGFLLNEEAEKIVESEFKDTIKKAKYEEISERVGFV